MITSSKTKKESSRRQSKKSEPFWEPIWLIQPLSYKSRTFVRRFQNELARRNILPRGAHILLAVSGGPDSMSLLFLLARLAPKYDWELHLAHVNYHLRGEDSERDEALVRETAKHLNIPCSVQHSRIKPKENIEETLRKIRYSFFERVREKYDLDLIATAHTQNDLAETFLMNLLRGSGLRGLAPFQIEGPGLVRPLLSFKRSLIINFLETEKLPFRIDKSNASPLFTRNRIRHRLLPFLQKEFNPNIIATLARTAETQGKDEEVTSSFQPFVIRLNQWDFEFDRSAVLSLSRSARLQFLATFFRGQLGQSPSRAFLQECILAIESPKPKRKSVENRDLKMNVLHGKVKTTFKH